jgi:hypothetical protein
MPLVTPFQVADGLAGSCVGVRQGQGLQHLDAFFNTIEHYVLAPSLLITLDFRTNYRVEGLWIGACPLDLALAYAGFLFVCLFLPARDKWSHYLSWGRASALSCSSVRTGNIKPRS